MIFNKTTYICCLMFLSFLLGAQKKTIQLEFKYYEPYCGGARPTDEILEEAQKAKPYANRKMILVSSNGAVDTFWTDVKGKLKIKVRKGEYKMYEPWRYYKQSFSGAPVEQFDLDCLKKEWSKATVEISVTRKKTNIAFTNDLQNYCDWSLPCLLESQMPPMRE